MTIKEKVIKTPHDKKIDRLSAMSNRTVYEDNMLRKSKGLRRSYRTGYHFGYQAGIEAHDCQDTGCPCYQRGKQDAYENPIASGATV